LPDIETLLTNSRAVIRHGGPRAFYSPATDHIQLPPKEAFARAAGYYSTALHELGHWTGGREDRVPRNLKGKFGSENYAREELRAEMASAFLCAALGTVNEIEENASYIASWLQVLKEDKHEIFRAASDAQKITEYCLQFSPKHKETFAPVQSEI
jgi:antirestriction protein ArdC